MISEEENQKEKDLFLKNYSSCFTPYLSIEKLSQKIPSFRYLNDELKKLETTSPESTIKHVMGKKKLLSSKNAKQLCRDGIPIKHIKQIVLKMFNVEYSKEDYENKRKEVLKGREFSEMGDQVPTFCNKSLEELLPFHYLNEKGLLFLTKEETYELVRNVIETDMNPGDLSSIRWHFRYNMDDNIKLYISISLAIVELSKQEVKNKFLQIEKHGLRRIKLVQDIIDQFFLDYINFIGIIKLLPFFLLEGVKGIYRFVYGLISLIHFKIESKEKDNFTQDKKTGELVTLNDKISTKTETIKLSPSEIIKLYKDFSNQYQNWNLFMDTITLWDLTHRNNTYTSIKIPSELRKAYNPIEQFSLIQKFYQHKICQNYGKKCPLM